MSSTVQLTVSRRVADPSRLVIGGLDVSTLGQLLGSCPPEALRGLQALLSSRDIASIALGSPTEQAIVAAIDKIEPQVSGSFDAALLALFAKDLPSHHAALLAAYARTRRASARIEAIRHLAMVPDVDMRDDLADLWLKSDGFSGIDVASLAMHNTGYDTPLDLLLLARRRYQERTRTTQKREFDIRASAHVRAALSVESGRGAFDYPDPAVWQVAVRAGLDPWPTEAQLRQNDLENIDFWSFLATRPPTRQRLHDIFKLSARKRAVFGLCSPDEWQMFAADKRTRDLIVHCRWERPLDFLSRGD